MKGSFSSASPHSCMIIQQEHNIRTLCSHPASQKQQEVPHKVHRSRWLFLGKSMVFCRHEVQPDFGYGEGCISDLLIMCYSLSRIVD